MKDSELITKLAEVQDAICEIVDYAMTMREVRARLNAVYPQLAAVVDTLVKREAAMVDA